MTGPDFRSEPKDIVAHAHQLLPACLEAVYPNLNEYSTLLGLFGPLLHAVVVSRSPYEPIFPPTCSQP